MSVQPLLLLDEPLANPFLGTNRKHADRRFVDPEEDASGSSATANLRRLASAMHRSGSS